MSIHRLFEAHTFPILTVGISKEMVEGKPSNSITTWDNLVKKFLIRFFPSGKTTRLRSEILSFKQKPDENLYHSWERFKSLLRDCPHHQQTNEVSANTFVEGLDHNTKIFLDSTAGG